jgi:hypothetical protein
LQGVSAHVHVNHSSDCQALTRPGGGCRAGKGGCIIPSYGTVLLPDGCHQPSIHCALLQSRLRHAERFPSRLLTRDDDAPRAPQWRSHGGGPLEGGSRKGATLCSESCQDKASVHINIVPLNVERLVQHALRRALQAPSNRGNASRHESKDSQPAAGKIHKRAHNHTASCGGTTARYVETGGGSCLFK